MFARFRRIARWLGRRERVTKRLCLAFLGLAVLGFVVMLVAPGGPSGAVGVIACVLAVLAVVLAILAMIVWAFCGTAAEVSNHLELRMHTGVVVTPRVAHTNLSRPVDSIAAFNSVLADRGMEPADFSDPGHVLANVEWARSIREFSLEEANLVWDLVAQAVRQTSEDLSAWSVFETAAELVGGGVARLRLEPGAVPPAPEPAAPRDRVRTRFGATETAGLHRVPLHERAINVLGGLSVIALFTAKFFVLLPGRSGAGRPPVPAWYWMLLVAVAVLALLSYCLKFIRGRRASAWTIRGIESGICVESKRYAGRVIEVPADRCWVWVTRQPKVARFAPEQYTWVFSLPEHPHTLRCDGFDLRAKPWGAWLDEWRELAGAQPELEPD